MPAGQWRRCGWLAAQPCPPAGCLHAWPSPTPQAAELASWQALLERSRSAGLMFGIEPKLRFAGEELEHHTFFLIDPAGNWLEFKRYSDPEAVLGWRSHTQVGDSRHG